MGLMTILKKVRMKEREMRVLILGLDNAGKTTVVKHLKGENVLTISPTLGFEICTMTHGMYTLNIWDIGGQQTIRAYWRNYFESTDAIVWVVDSADTRRMKTCRQELETVLKEEKLSGASLLVLANKQDLPGAIRADEIASNLGLYDTVGKRRHWKVFPTSAVSVTMDSDGRRHADTSDVICGTEALREALEWLVSDVAARVFVHD